MAESVLAGSQALIPSGQQMCDAQAVTRIRGLLRLNPRSPALWADLSRHFASLGETDKSIRSMWTAVGLAPNHRWILRAANRLLLHVERPDDAHKLLVRNARTPGDPWLLSAELATAQILQRGPKFMRQAKDLLRHKALPAAHMSELAAAVATSFLDDGNRKGARRLLRIALQDPTENALAQVEWADRESQDGLHVESAMQRLSDAYEAECWVHYNAGRITEALRSAHEWLQDEPYADRPASMLCHVAGLLDDYDTYLDVTKQLLYRHPEDMHQRNNIIFIRFSSTSYFHAADPTMIQADVQFLHRRVQARERDYSHSLANLGLHDYRTGQLEDGRANYERAIAAIEKSGLPGAPIVSASAALYHAREAILARAAWAPKVLDDARRLVRRGGGAGLAFQLRKTEALAAKPDDAATILHPSSAERFLARSARAEHQQLLLDKHRGHPVVWVPAHLRR